MAGPDSGTSYPATEYFLRGVAVDVTHTSGGKAVTREAVVNIETVTFLEKDGTRKVSTASCTFLESVGVESTDRVTLPAKKHPGRCSNELARTPRTGRRAGIR